MHLFNKVSLTALATFVIVDGGVSCFSPPTLLKSSKYGNNVSPLQGATSLFMSTVAAPSDVTMPRPPKVQFSDIPNEVAAENPLRVIIAGGGVGGLALANALVKMPHVSVTVIERTSAFKRFGGPIQLASNALQILSVMDAKMYDEIMAKFTFTGDKMNGIKDGIRDDWYAKFDLKTPAQERNMPFTGVIERPDLQEIYLNSLPEGTMRNGDGLESYKVNRDGYGVSAITESGEVVEGDILIGADGIWSAVRSTMRNEPLRGEGSGVAYSGYTLFAGELRYDSFDNGEVGYKVYIGPNQYFVVTDVGKGRYQWYAFLARPPGSAGKEKRPNGNVPYLKDIFVGWSEDIHHILDATKEHEIEQRDLYDRPPSVNKPWIDERVALIGDSVHAMMPNLGQGGCQAIEDAFVLSQNIQAITKRDQIPGALNDYHSRRLIRSAAVQGLSRFASDIIIRGFDTPAKITFENGSIQFENFKYAGIVTRVLQPILPIFFMVQFNFLYDGWKNEMGIDFQAAQSFLAMGGLICLLAASSLGEFSLSFFGLEGLIGAEGVEGMFGAGLSPSF